MVAQGQGSLAQLHEAPRGSLLLLVGPPGAGKSTFCRQVVLGSLAVDRPVIYVTTERRPAQVVGLLSERGLGEAVPTALSFVDAFAQTVGLSTAERADTVGANCEDLNTIAMAMAKLQRRIGRSDILLAFDSLTSPYLFHEKETFRFIRLCLLKFAAEGNSVIALMDEGCGKDEDVGAMMSLANGVIQMALEDGDRIVNVVKHPVLEPARIEFPTDRDRRARALDAALWDPEVMKLATQALQRGDMGRFQAQMGVNIFWPNLMHWSGMAWDRHRFPLMTYEVWKAYSATARDMIAFFPWYGRLFFKTLPKSFATVKDMRRMARFLGRMFRTRHDGIVEYVPAASTTDEHCFRVHENIECWGFDDVGTVTSSRWPPTVAGLCKGFEREEREWNAIETRCIGLGDPYCEFKVVAGEIPGLRASLQKDPTTMERIRERLMQRLMGFLLEDKPLLEGRKLGVDFIIENILPLAGGERYRMALRMGGAKTGKEVGERLVQAGIAGDGAVKRFLGFLEHCRVGEITADETIRIWNSRESGWTEWLTTKWEEPACFFITGFLNGFFAAVKDQHVREIKCIAMGDPYCEWEIIYLVIAAGGARMESSGVLFAQLQDVPKNSLILLSGPPGAGKSTFCQQVVLNGLAMDRPVIFVTTEHGPSEVENRLKARGMGEPAAGALSFVDAFGETVGETTPQRPDTLSANCEDLNSISMAISRQHRNLGRSDVLLAFDSLTSPYLFNEKEVFRFVRLCLAKFASEGNSVLALMDEGCGKQEDLGAMMSVADGILRMETRDSSRTVSVVKHPTVETARIGVPVEPRQPQFRPEIEWDRGVLARFVKSMMQAMTKGQAAAALRPEVGDFVNLIWPDLTHWSCMLWDPKGFPTMLYELNKYEASSEDVSAFPWYARLLFGTYASLQSVGLLPSKLDHVRDMKTATRLPPLFTNVETERSGILEYVEDASKADEHTFRVYENSDCVGFENVGVPIASHVPPMLAGYCLVIEGRARDWNAVETKCLGLGDPYCEFRLVPGEIVGLKASLEMDSSAIERIHERLMTRVMGFLLDGKALVHRPGLGSDVHLHVLMHGMGYLNLTGERYRRVQMMGAARSGKMIGERLIDAGLSDDEALERVRRLLEHCKVGKVTLGETIRIRENCESLRTTILKHREEPSCFFTTGFLNGLFSAVKDQHVRETRCVAAGDPYCEWETV
jgi:KaiC/GvpD/RAD55 family RecA-like ATPase/predicted hydrocarbon binding protein